MALSPSCLLENIGLIAARGTDRCSGDKGYEKDGWTDPILQLARTWFGADKLVPRCRGMNDVPPLEM